MHFAIELGNEHYAPLLSSQGHIVGLVDMETGKLANRSALTMFGKDLSDNPLSPWRFCRKRHEVAELGIIDFGYRHYHPRSATWLTQDPLDECDGPNLYAYVKNSPACNIDRFGLFMDDWSFSDAWDSVKDFFSWGSSSQTTEMGCRDSYGLTNSPDYAPEQTECLEVSSIWSDLCPSTEGLISLGLDLTPGIGSLKSLEEFAVGTNALTGEKVGKLEAGIGCVPCVKGLAKVGKGAFNLSKRVGRAASSFFRSSKTVKYLPFTERNFRSNLKQLSGMSPPRDMHAHHVFPKEHADRFAERGINVHDPKHGAWWQDSPHWEAHGKQKYNDVWDGLLDKNPPLNKEQLYQEGREMMRRYGNEVYF